jgi:hypothetical protein
VYHRVLWVAPWRLVRRRVFIDVVVRVRCNGFVQSVVDRSSEEVNCVFATRVTIAPKNAI